MIEDLRAYLERKKKKTETAAVKEARQDAFAVAEAVCWDLVGTYSQKKQRERELAVQEAAKLIRQLREAV